MKRIIVRTVLAAVGVVVLLFGYTTLFFYVVMPRVTKGEHIPQYAAGKSALLVIDIQEAVTGSSSNVKGLVRQSGPLIETVNRVIGEAQAAQMPVIYIRQEYTDQVFNALSGRMLAAGSPGARIDARVNVVGENVFPKHIMDAFSNPDLDAFLRKNEVDRLYVTGVDAAYCVRRTVEGALNRGYAVTVVRDGIAAGADGAKEKMLDEYARKGAVLVDAARWRE